MVPNLQISQDSLIFHHTNTHPRPVTRGEADALLGAVVAASLVTPGVTVGGQASVGEAGHRVPPLVLPHVHVAGVAQQVVPRLIGGAAWWW